MALSLQADCMNVEKPTRDEEVGVLVTGIVRRQRAVLETSDALPAWVGATFGLLVLEKSPNTPV